MTTIPRDRVARIIAQHEADEARVRARVRSIVLAAKPWVLDGLFIIGILALGWAICWLWTATR